MRTEVGVHPPEQDDEFERFKAERLARGKTQRHHPEGEEEKDDAFFGLTPQQKRETRIAASDARSDLSELEELQRLARLAEERQAGEPTGAAVPPPSPTDLLASSGEDPEFARFRTKRLHEGGEAPTPSRGRAHPPTARREVPGSRPKNPPRREVPGSRPKNPPRSEVPAEAGSGEDARLRRTTARREVPGSRPANPPRREVPGSRPANPPRREVEPAPDDPEFARFREERLRQERIERSERITLKQPRPPARRPEEDESAEDPEFARFREARKRKLPPGE